MPVRKSSKPAGALAEYEAKRNFSSTPEPRGAQSQTSNGQKRIFCVQKHLASHLHYDFRLEHNGALLSWAVPKGPSLNPKDKRLAMRVEDHPYDYAEFEGVIPEGYGAGIVMLWDQGTWTPEPGFEDIDAAIADGEIKFRLDGVKLKGSWVLIRTHSDGYPEGRTWLLIKHRDEWAGEIDVAQVAPDSVKSSEDFAGILAKDKPPLWESNRPARGGSTGRILAEVIEQAARRKLAARRKKSAKTSKRTRSTKSSRR